MPGINSVLGLVNEVAGMALQQSALSVETSF